MPAAAGAGAAGGSSIMGPVLGGLAAGTAGSLLSKGGGGTTTSTQSNEPWLGIQPYLGTMFVDANNLRARGPYDYVANQSPFTAQAQQLMAQRALDPNSLTGRAQQVLGDTISGKYMDFANNAALQDALGVAGSTFAKQYGGQAGQNLGNSGYQEALARGLGAVAASTYNQERQNQLNATQLAPSLDYANLQALAGVGAQQEALKQQQFNSPWQNLANYQAFITGNYGGQGQSTSPYFTNPLANALGLGLGGMALYNGLGGGSLFGASQVPEYVAGQYSLANPQYG